MQLQKNWSRTHTHVLTKLVRLLTIDLCAWSNSICNQQNNNQSNLTTGGIASAKPPKLSFVFTGWQHKANGLAALHVLAGSWPKFPLPLGVKKHNVSLDPHKCTCQMAWKSAEQFEQTNSKFNYPLNSFIIFSKQVIILICKTCKILRCDNSVFPSALEWTFPEPPANARQNNNTSHIKP